jgi:peptide/nickel transport system ATP-binding protein
VRAGETMAIVGESGCGKTTLLMELLAMVAPAVGHVSLIGRDVSTLDRAQRQALRRDVQVVFQDPMASLDPRLPIIDIIGEPLHAHGFSSAQIAERVPELMTMVGLSPQFLERYPAEFSGGQRQRIGIARALATSPKLILLDEPVSALDVSVRAGVLNLLADLQRTQNLAFIVVSHDLSVVRHIADRVAVMHLGRFVEVGDVDDVFDTPAHPYTQALISAIPIPDPVVERQRRRIVLDGDPPSALNPPTGCRFAGRCFVRTSLSKTDQQRCDAHDPPLSIPTTITSTDWPTSHEVACYFPTLASAPKSS